MTDDIKNVLLEELQLIRTDMAAIKDDLREVNARLSKMEVEMGTALEQIAVWRAPSRNST